MHRESGSSQERRQLPRLTFTHQLFRLQDNGKVFGVVDLSIGGMALRVIDGADHILFTVGRKLEGTLNLDGERIAVVAQVMSLRGERVGLEFKNLTDPARKEILARVEPELMAQTLRPMPPSSPLLQWFHGSNGLDLYVWCSKTAPHAPERFCILMSGQVVMCDGMRKVLTGKQDGANVDPVLHGMVQEEMQQFQTDAEVDIAKLTIAKKVILSSKVPEELKTWIATLLSNS